MLRLLLSILTKYLVDYTKWHALWLNEKAAKVHTSSQIALSEYCSFNHCLGIKEVSHTMDRKLIFLHVCAECSADGILALRQY